MSTIEVLDVHVNGLPAKFRQEGDTIHVTAVTEIPGMFLTVEYLSELPPEEDHDEHD